MPSGYPLKKSMGYNCSSRAFMTLDFFLHKKIFNQNMGLTWIDNIISASILEMV
jgi:hypothetical protein